MKKIYFVLTATGTILSKIIRAYTKDEFSHVSISLDKELQHMYSFGRLHPYNAFSGGFVHEYIDKGTFKRFYKTQSVIYEYEIEDKQYDLLKQTVLNFQHKKNSLKFNLIGLLAVGFNIKYQKENSYYCAEFIKFATEQSGIKLNLPEIVRPENFKDIDGKVEIYQGLLRKYIPEKDKITI